MTAEQPAKSARPVARVRSEHIITFAEAALLFPEDRRPTVGTVLGWVIRGRGRVKLEATRVDGERRTSVEALRRFRAATGLALACLFELGTLLVD